MHNKELYENIHILRDAINYDKSNGKSAVTLLLGLQQEFKKILLLHLWMGQQISGSSLLKDWPARKSLEPGIINVVNQPLVEPSKI